MARISVLLLAVALNGCTQRSERIMLMDEIESAVRLPMHALPLNRYARAYATAPNRRVAAVYFVPSPPNGDFCATALAREKDGAQTALFCPPPKGMKPGERRWFENYKFLPSASDGGCAWIDIQFSLDTRAVEKAACHGDG